MTKARSRKAKAPRRHEALLLPLPLSRCSQENSPMNSNNVTEENSLSQETTGATENSPSPILTVPSSSALRAELERVVLNDLLGPAGGPEEEVDESHVSDRYLVGMMAPRQQRNDPEEFDELAAEGDDTIEDGAADVNTPQASTLFPSSFGMTFCVTGSATALTVTAGWGRYARERSQTLVNEKTDEHRLVWKRKPM